MHSLAAMVEKGAAYLVEGDAKQVISPLFMFRSFVETESGDWKRAEWLDRIFPASQWKRMDILRLKVKKNISDKIHNF